MQDPVALYDARRKAFYHFFFARFFARHMRAARVARWGVPSSSAAFEGPLPPTLRSPLPPTGGEGWVRGASQPPTPSKLQDPPHPSSPPVGGRGEDIVGGRGEDAGGAKSHRPLVVFANHPGWWDGVAVMLLSQSLFPGRPMFIPMEQAALARYGFMRRIGVFGIEAGSPRGAVAFLRTAKQVLATPHHMLWMNAPGRFSDVRERPVPIAPGLVRLPEIAPDAIFVPLALDYPFWTERRPEMLCAFGPAIAGATLAALPRDQRAEALSTALGETMDRLALDAITRDPARFTTLLRGEEGMGGIWQAWSRLRAALRGQRFDPRHDPRAEAG